MAKKKPVAKKSGSTGGSRKRPTSSPRTCAPLPSGSPSVSPPCETSSDGLVVKTRAEVAKELKRRIGKGSVRSLCDWLKQGCPGTAGAYNVDEIEAWVRDNVGTDEDDETSEKTYWATFKLREQALAAQVDRLVKDGSVVETAIINALVERLANTLSTMLNQLPDWTLSQLPAAVTSKQRSEYRGKVVSKIDEFRSLVADLIDEWSQAQRAASG